MQIKCSLDIGAAFDMLSIMEVKQFFKADEENQNKLRLLEQEILGQIDKDLYFKIKSSLRYIKLYKTNIDIFLAVNKSKINAISAFTVDYYNWVRFIHKTALQRQFFASGLTEIKIGYEDRIYIEMDDYHLLLLVDLEDYEVLKNYTIKMYGKLYPAFLKGFVHRFILSRKFDINNYQVDHINGNIMDCRKKNLRIATQSQNSGNTFIKKNNTSGYKGVVKCKTTGKWVAQIRFNGKSKRIGYFNDKRDAAIAYDIYAKEVFKEFAKINIHDASPEETQKIRDFLLTYKKQKCSSVYFGVSWYKKNSMWKAEFVNNSKRFYIGYFTNEKDAALAVDKKLLEIGEVKKLNFNEKRELIF